MDVEHENQDDQTNDTNTANTVENSVGSQESVPDNPVFSAPFKRDSSGRFTKGTGSRGHLGGRPKGSKDKLSVAFLQVMESVIEEKGSEMMMRLAEENPAAALAIISRSLPPKAMQEAIDGAGEQDQEAINQITINLVGKPTEQRLEAPQERLTAPVERLPEPTQDDLRDVIEAEVDAPTEPLEPTQADLDREAALAERERIRRQNESIRQYDSSAHTGMPSREKRSSSAGVEYKDDPSVI